MNNCKGKQGICGFFHFGFRILIQNKNKRAAAAALLFMVGVFL